MLVLLFLLVAILNATKHVTKVVIVGAGTKVGNCVFSKLIHRKQFYPIGLVRDTKGYQALKDIGAKDDQIQICDITKKSMVHGLFNGAQKCVICSTAVPKLKLSYKLRNGIRNFLGKHIEPSPNDFYYPKNQTPYHVDFLGQKNVIDECSKAQIDQIVLLGNMGGYRGSKINEIGRKNANDDVKIGNILKWKRASERYLMKKNFFTIIHAGTITDEKGGKKEVVWDTDDALLRKNFKKISKEDAAEVIVQALIWKESINRSIDIANLPNDVADANEDNTSSSSFLASTTTTKDWLRFWSRPGDCVYPADFDDLNFK